jgi:hypothetical protein
MTTNEKAQEMQENLVHCTFDQGIEFECACDTIANMIGLATAQIEAEKKAATPNSQRIEHLLARISKLAAERRDLHVQDVEAVARINTEYGALIKQSFEIQDISHDLWMRLLIPAST